MKKQAGTLDRGGGVWYAVWERLEAEDFFMRTLRAAYYYFSFTGFAGKACCRM